jgi:hypothetical protein
MLKYMNSFDLHEKPSDIGSIEQYDGYSLGRIASNMVEIKFNVGFEGELEDAKQIVHRLSKYCINKKPILLLAVYAEDNIFSKEARQFVASKAVNEYVKAEALVLNSMALRIMGNFYLKVNKPARQSKLFNNRAAAIEWLSTR